MSLDSKVVWSEGMFLNPQHFQQQERYFERYINGKCEAYGAYGWGVSEFEIDQQLLKLGKLSVIKAKGVFPDGTPFSVPDMNDPPPVIDLPENLHNVLVYLAIPVRRLGAVDVLREEQSQGLARYYLSEMQARDVAEEGSENLKLDVAKLRIKLLLETDDLSGYTTVGVIKINETREDKNIILDNDYIPTCIDINVSARLSGFLTELVGLLRSRIDEMAGRMADANRGGSAEISDYMQLQLYNRIEPFMNHLSSIQGLHPIVVYGQILQVLGELATFFAEGRRPPAFAPYLHDDLTLTFSPVMAEFRKYMTRVSVSKAEALPLEEKGYGIRVSQINDRSMLTTCVFVLAVRADVQEEIIRTRFPSQIKIGPVEKIRQLVNAAMPGVTLKPLPVAPREVPFRSGYSYFELERNNPLWKDLQVSGAFALHVGGDFPGLELEFWSIRQQ